MVSITLKWIPFFYCIHSICSWEKLQKDQFGYTCYWDGKGKTCYKWEKKGFFVYWEPVKFESSSEKNYYFFCEEKDKKFCVDTFTFLEEIPYGESICQTITFQNFKHTKIIQV